MVNVALNMQLKGDNIIPFFFFYSWDQAYDREIKSFNDVGDVGEIWYLKVRFIKIMKWNKRNLSMESMHFTIESYCKYTHDGYDGIYNVME